jgi:hypothetical protein
MRATIRLQKFQKDHPNVYHHHKHLHGTNTKRRMALIISHPCSRSRKGERRRNDAADKDEEIAYNHNSQRRPFPVDMLLDLRRDGGI